MNSYEISVPQSLIDLINQGAIINFRLSAKDIARANNIYGPDLAFIKGKSRKKKVSIPPIDFLPREITSELILNTDKMFVN